MGTNASSPQAHYLDNEDLTAEAGLEITSEVARLYASKGYVNSAVSVSAGEISSQVSNQISGLSTSITQTTNNISAKVNNIEEGLLDTGIDITSKKIVLTAENVTFQGNNPEDVGKVEIMANGGIKAVDANITGTINATQGILGKLSISPGGYIELPPTFASRKGRLDNNGLQLVYDGSNSQSIEWYTGLGTYSGTYCT